MRMIMQEQSQKKDRDAAPLVIRAATLAWTQAQVQLRHFGIDASQANLFQQLAGHIVFATAAARAPADAIRRGAAGPGGLWSQSISGDLPIVLLRIEDLEDMAVVRQLLQAHELLVFQQVEYRLLALLFQHGACTSSARRVIPGLLTLGRRWVCERF